MRRTNLLFDFPALLLVACTACSSAAGTASAPAPTESTAPKGYIAADVQFMQGMIGHHAQALAMSGLIAGRTRREDFRSLGERIRLSQEAEISRMQQWLRKRNAEVPDGTAHSHVAAGHGTLMPGMLSATEMSQLEIATGTEFERLFLQSMIKHHEGALTMVRQLFATQGAGQEPELYILANDIDADQNAELRR